MDTQMESLSVIPDSTYGSMYPLAGGYTGPAIPGNNVNAPGATVQTPAVLLPPINILPNPKVEEVQSGQVLPEQGATTDIQGSTQSKLSTWGLLGGFFLVAFLIMDRD